MSKLLEISDPSLDARFADCAEVLAEFAAAGDDVHGDGSWGDDQPEHTEAGYAGYLQRRRLESTQPSGVRVPCTYFWIVDGANDELVGFLALRHELNDFLLAEGGHIGYSVRPGRRRRGHASAGLAAAVAYAHAMGIDSVLVTCDEDNEPSRRTIEGNDGVLEDRRAGKLRYWISTTRRAGSR